MSSKKEQPSNKPNKRIKQSSKKSSGNFPKPQDRGFVISSKKGVIQSSRENSK